MSALPFGRIREGDGAQRGPTGLHTQRDQIGGQRDLRDAALVEAEALPLALFDGATNGERVRASVRNTLAPALRPGDTVVLDNLGAHKVAGVREAIRQAFARFTPKKCRTDLAAGYESDVAVAT